MAASDSHLIGNCHKVIDGVSGERERSLIGQTLVSKHKKKIWLHVLVFLCPSSALCKSAATGGASTPNFFQPQSWGPQLKCFPSLCGISLLESQCGWNILAKSSSRDNNFCSSRGELWVQASGRWVDTTFRSADGTKGVTTEKRVHQ